VDAKVPARPYTVCVRRAHARRNDGLVPASQQGSAAGAFPRPDDYKRRELAELAIEIHLHPPSLAVASASTPIEEPFAAVVRRRIVETMDELERTKATCRQLAESLRGLKDGLKIRKDLEADRRAESVIDTIIADARAATEIKEQDR